MAYMYITLRTVILCFGVLSLLGVGCLSFVRTYNTPIPLLVVVRQMFSLQAVQGWVCRSVALLVNKRQKKSPGQSQHLASADGPLSTLNTGGDEMDESLA